MEDASKAKPIRAESKPAATSPVLDNDTLLAKKTTDTMTNMIAVASNVFDDPSPLFSTNS